MALLLLLLPHASSVVSSSRGAKKKMMMGNTTTTTSSRPPMRPRDDGVHRIRRGRRRGGRGETLTTFVSSFALPPANEVAGFLVGGIMLCVVLRASTLDAVIASAQAKSVARDDDVNDDDDADGGKKSGVVVFGRADEKDESVKRVKRGKGNVFILPPSSEGLKEK